MKVVINSTFGGFSISIECAKYMAKLGDKQAAIEVAEWEKEQKWLDEFNKTGKWNNEIPKQKIGMLEISAKYNSPAQFYGYGYVKGFDNGYERTNENLVKAVEHLGEKASGSCAALKVVEIPDGVDWEISEYDGLEHIAEKHRTWY